MRSHRWILLAAAVGILAVGCDCELGNGGAPPDTTPSPITSISAPVVGYTGTADAQFEAREPESDELLASGTLDAAASRFEATFRPLADVPAVVLEPGLPEFELDDGDLVCDVTVTPATLRTTGVFMFEQVDGFGMLFLSTFDFFFGFDPSAVTVGSRLYAFLLADRAGRFQGSCEALDGNLTVEYALDLAHGWNSMAFVITAVDGAGSPVGWRVQNEHPTSEATWFYFGIDLEFPD